MELDLSRLPEAIKVFLSEDIGFGDITTNSIVPKNSRTKGIIYAKEEGVLAGLPVAEAVFNYLSPQIKFLAIAYDGQKVTKGSIIAEIDGETRGILTGERTALNCLQRMSGIATYTSRLVELVGDHSVKIVDTRKTTPGIRFLEKYAVKVGGGYNHRFGLYDAVLIKDNHIKAAGGIKEAIKAVRNNLSHVYKVEVEVESMEQVKMALEAGADIIMLDNMDVNTMQEVVKLVNGKAIVEASGGINDHNLELVAKTGVDYISIGSLTHSVKALDISLDIKSIKNF